MIFHLLTLCILFFAKSEEAPPTETRVAIYRYYSKSLYDHYYTNEYTILHNGNDIYKYEGVGFYLAKQQDELENSLPLYQYYSEDPTIDHTYTINPSDITDDESDKEILGYCYPEEYKRDGMLPLHKYYHDERYDHLYTTSQEEYGMSKIDGYVDEHYQYKGIECYVFPSFGDKVNKRIFPKFEKEDLTENIDDDQLDDVDKVDDDEIFLFIAGDHIKVSGGWRVYGFIGFVLIAMISIVVFHLYCYGKGANKEHAKMECALLV